MNVKDEGRKSSLIEFTVILKKASQPGRQAKNSTLFASPNTNNNATISSMASIGIGIDDVVLSEDRLKQISRSIRSFLPSADADLNRQIK